jgi:hypothetical protein
VNDVRNGMLSEIAQCCSIALEAAIANKPPHCAVKYCTVSKVGAMTMSFAIAGVVLRPEGASTMYQSVLQYWQDLKNMDADYKGYAPCDKTYMGYGTHISACNFEKCFGDFGVIRKPRNILKRYVHKDVWAQWERVSLRIRSSISLLTEIVRHYQDLMNSSRADLPSQCL